MAASILQYIRMLGGTAATHELFHAGFTRSNISAELDGRRIVRVRQGWYAGAGTHPELLRAVRVGGRAACTTALRLQGIWTVSDDHTHVVVDRNACQLRSPLDARQRRSSHDSVVVHWRDTFERSRLISEPLHAIEDLCACATPELVLASADSLLHQQPQQRQHIRRLASRLNSAHRLALLTADGLCESGIESLFWYRLRRLGPRRQVAIAGVGRVDFLFGDRLVVEVDGAEFHSDSNAFESDRNRDALLSSLGYRSLRFSYRQIMIQWDDVLSAVVAAIARGDRY